MGWFGTTIVALILGLIAGAIARAVVPGSQNMGIVATIALGLIGSLVGGFLGKVLFGKDSGDGFFQLSGLFGSIVGAIIVLAVSVWMGNRRRV